MDNSKTTAIPTNNFISIFENSFLLKSQTIDDKESQEFSSYHYTEHCWILN